MATIVNTPLVVNGGSTYTAEAGSSRVLVLGLAREPSATGVTPTVTALTWGTCSLANGKIVQANVQVQGALNRIAAYHWYIKEADILSGAQTVTPTWSTTMGGANDIFLMYTLQGVDQTTPVDATSGDNPASGTNPISGTFVVGNNTVQVLDAAINSSNSSTPTSPWTELADNTDTAYRRVSHSLVTSSGGSVGWGMTFGANNTGAVVVTSFAAAAGTTNADVGFTNMGRGAFRGIGRGF